MRSNRMWMRGFVALLGLALALTLPFAGSAAAPSPKIVRIAVHEPPDRFDPATLYGNRSIELAQNVFNGLLDLDEQMRVVPAIASDFTVSADGLVYTFNLRRNVKFHNGDPVTARDFVYSWNRALGPTIGNPHQFFMTLMKGARAVTRGQAQEAEGIRALDDYRLQVTLEQPAGYFPNLVTRWPYWVVNRRTIDRNGAKWTEPPHIAGTGPYRLSVQVMDQRYVFTANPDYFGGKPAVDRIEVLLIRDASSQLARYEAGELDVIFNLPAADVRRIENDQRFRGQFGKQSVMRTTWLGFLNSKPPFNDKRVRQAFLQAINTELLVRIALAGEGAPAHTLLSPGIPGNVVSSRRPLAFNPQQARQLLSEAGFPDGRGLPPLRIHFAATTENQTVMEFVQAQLRENLGIQVALEAMPSREFTALMANSATRPFLFRNSFGADYPDPQEYHEYLGTCGIFANREEYCNREFDALIRRANATTNYADRIRLHEQAENLYLDDVPMAPLYYPIVTWLSKPAVRNFGFTPLYQRQWRTLTLAR